jgi:hypothetical protein
MASQKEIFSEDEGDQWFQRNKKYLMWLTKEDNHIINLIQPIELSPKKLLEVSCSDDQWLEMITL